MNSLEIIDKKNNLQKEANELINLAEKEVRKLTDLENNRFTAIKAEISDLDKEIENRNKNKTIKKKMEFSLLKSINAIANNRQLDETAQEIVNVGMNEFRKAGQNYSGQIVLPMEYRTIDGVISSTNTYTADTNNGGKENVPEDKLGILEPLRNKLVLVKAGATYMTGLVGDVSIPAYGGSTIGWAAENSTGSNGTGNWSEITLSPKRLTAYVDVSKQFLIQDSNDAETMLKRDIINALSSKLESTILGSAAGSSTQPSGIFYNGASTYNGALTYGNFVSMEADIEGANIVNEPVYIMHPSAKALCRKTSIDSGSGRFVMENGEISGLPVLITSNIASGLQTAADEYGIILGDFSDYIIGQWGGIDLTIDPYTQATAGKVRLVINAYFDAKPRRNSSFVTASIK